jgi:type IV pilus assembly protein PilE
MRIRVKGVTLIELMIVIVVVGTLAAIAIPSYRSYVLRSHRTEAKTALLALAAAQEKHYVVNNTYAAAGVLSSAPPTGLGIAATTERGWYTIAITAATAAGFTATATATGAQTADRDCAVFTINAQGARTATRSGGGDTSTLCWN